jgi:membrane protein
MPSAVKAYQSVGRRPVILLCSVAGPLLIAFAAAVSLVPLPNNLFDQILALMARFVPPDSMRLVRTVLRDVITPHGGSLLSVGIVLTIWTASGGVVALIEAVNVAYDLPDKRSFVQRSLLAIALMLAVGALAIIALFLLVVGPEYHFRGLVAVFAVGALC